MSDGAVFEVRVLVALEKMGFFSSTQPRLTTLVGGRSSSGSIRGKHCEIGFWMVA